MILRESYPQAEWTGQTLTARVSRVPLCTALGEVLANAAEAGSDKDRIHVLGSADRIALSLSNTGRELSDIEVSQLFVPWFTTKSGHAGLGLSIAQTALEQVGGRLYLEATAPVTFAIEVPAAP